MNTIQKRPGAPQAPSRPVAGKPAPQPPTLGKPVAARPQPAPPTAANGSVEATDGTTIAWHTAPDGTITATGPAQTLVVTRQKTSTGSRQVQTATEHGASTPYLRFSSVVESILGEMTITVSAGTSELTVSFKGVTAKNRQASTVLSGSVGGKAYHWSGTVDLSVPPNEMKPIPGWPSGVFKAQSERVGYFSPAVLRFPTIDGSASAQAAVGARHAPRPMAVDGGGRVAPAADPGKTVGGAVISGLFAVAVAGALGAMEVATAPAMLVAFVLTVPFEMTREQIMSDPPEGTGSSSDDGDNGSGAPPTGGNPSGDDGDSGPGDGGGGGGDSGGGGGGGDGGGGGGSEGAGEVKDELRRRRPHPLA